MMKDIDSKQRKCPTMQQLEYLMSLENKEGGRGIVTKVAEECGVNHAAVSRYLKSCQENGLLTDEFQFTKAGRIWLNGYKRILKDLDEYLEEIGTDRKAMEAVKKEMIEHIGYGTLYNMIQHHSRTKRILRFHQREEIHQNFLRDILPTWMEQPVYFQLFRKNQKTGYGVSMANEGFEKPATLLHNRRGRWLVLKVREMSAVSRINGRRMSGYMDSLKYPMDDTIHAVEIHDGVLRIPLKACQFHCRQGGEIEGMIPVTMTCSVGRTHMPESTALLVFWL